MLGLGVLVAVVAYATGAGIALSGARRACSASRSTSGPAALDVVHHPLGPQANGGELLLGAHPVRRQRLAVGAALAQPCSGTARML